MSQDEAHITIAILVTLATVVLLALATCTSGCTVEIFPIHLDGQKISRASSASSASSASQPTTDDTQTPDEILQEEIDRYVQDDENPDSGNQPPEEP